MILSVIIGQFPISFNIEENFNNIKNILDESNEDDLVILPEGAVSGYSDDISFLKNVDLEKLDNIISLLKEEAINRKIHIIFGSCIYEDSSWYNTAIGYSYCNNDFMYKKVNLATHERGVFMAGDELPVYEIKIKGQFLKFGIQLCREARYPEQWRILAMNGAQMFIYLTNAISGKGLSVWRSHLISRAAENQRFLLGSNNAHENQHCPTMLIGSDGEVISEIISKDLCIIKENIDTDNISNWYLNQSRNDILKIVLSS
jgi:predicted amidohydrolase